MAAETSDVGWRRNGEVHPEVEPAAPSPSDANAELLPDALEDRPVAEVATILPLCTGITNAEDPRGCNRERRCDGAGKCVSRFSEFLIPTEQARGVLPNRRITKGPDGNLWFNQTGYLIGRITPAGVITEFLASAPATDIVSGPGGNLWFTRLNGIASMTTAGADTTFFLPQPTTPPRLVVGPDGNLWFTLREGSVGRMTPLGQVTLFPMPTPYSQLLGLTVGPDGNIWFVEEVPPKIGRITPDGVITEFEIPVPLVTEALRSITTGSDNNLWFTAPGGDSIGRITTSGAVTLFNLRPAGFTYRGPAGIVSGPDGALWFASRSSGTIGRMTTDGVLTEYLIPGNSPSPDGIAVGPDGAIWFALRQSIGRFQPN